MHPKTNFIDKVLETVNQIELYSPVEIGKLRDENSIVMQIQSGYPQRTYYNKSELCVITLLFLSKHHVARTAYDALCVIADSLTKQGEIASRDYIWTQTTITTEPLEVLRQENGQCIYSCVLNVTAYI